MSKGYTLKTFLQLLLFLASLSALQASSTAQTVLIDEGFDNIEFASRGWFDNVAIRLAPGRNGQAAEFHWLSSTSTPVATTTGMRRTFAETPSIYVSYWVKYSGNWEGSNRTSHPHEIYLLTNLDGRWVNPASTHLTVYIEQNEGTPLVALQDALNVDTARVGTDLTSVTELRAVAGCNGGPGGCYTNAGRRVNELFLRGLRPILVPGRWHHVEAYIELNTIVSGIGQPNGIARVWWDGVLEVERTDVLFRTGRSPTMAFNEILIGPYMSSSPIDQTLWLDDLEVATAPPTPPEPLVAGSCVRLVPVACEPAP